MRIARRLGVRAFLFEALIAQRARELVAAFLAFRRFARRAIRHARGFAGRDGAATRRAARGRGTTLDGAIGGPPGAADPPWLAPPAGREPSWLVRGGVAPPAPSPAVVPFVCANAIAQIRDS